MGVLPFGLIGLATQIALLGAFVSISRTRFASTGKPIVVVAAFIALSVLLWFGIDRARKMTHILALPLILTLGYLVAFYVLGFFVFRGLLAGGSAAYIGSVFRVGCALLAMYSIATGLVYLLARSLKKQVRLQYGQLALRRSIGVVAAALLLTVAYLATYAVVLPFITMWLQNLIAAQDIAAKISWFFGIQAAGIVLISLPFAIVITRIYRQTGVWFAFVLTVLAWWASREYYSAVYSLVRSPAWIRWFGISTSLELLCVPPAMAWIVSGRKAATVQ